MAIIIETCPKCGHDLHDIMLASNPPIPKKECFNCGWSWQGEPEQIIRVPFSDEHIEPVIINNIEESDIDLFKEVLRQQPIQIFDVHGEDVIFQSCCEECPNNIKNGGSGICNCALPYMQNPITYTVPTDDFCMASNTNGYVYTVNNIDNLKKHQDNSNRIDEAVERIKKYIKE